MPEKTASPQALQVEFTTQRKGARQSQPAARSGHLRAGDLCPNCREQRLDYDGLLNLSCPRCGTLDGAWGGCS